MAEISGGGDPLPREARLDLLRKGIEKARRASHNGTKPTRQIFSLIKSHLVQYPEDKASLSTKGVLIINPSEGLTTKYFYGFCIDKEEDPVLYLAFHKALNPRDIKMLHLQEDGLNTVPNYKALLDKADPSLEDTAKDLVKEAWHADAILAAVNSSLFSHSCSHSSGCFSPLHINANFAPNLFCVASVNYGVPEHVAPLLRSIQLDPTKCMHLTNIYGKRWGGLVLNGEWGLIINALRDKNFDACFATIPDQDHTKLLEVFTDRGFRVLTTIKRISQSAMGPPDTYKKVWLLLMNPDKVDSLPTSFRESYSNNSSPLIAESTVNELIGVPETPKPKSKSKSKKRQANKNTLPVAKIPKVSNVSNPPALPVPILAKKPADLSDEDEDGGLPPSDEELGDLPLDGLEQMAAGDDDDDGAFPDFSPTSPTPPAPMDEPPSPVTAPQVTAPTVSPTPRKQISRGKQGLGKGKGGSPSPDISRVIRLVCEDDYDDPKCKIEYLMRKCSGYEERIELTKQLYNNDICKYYLNELFSGSHNDDLKILIDSDDPKVEYVKDEFTKHLVDSSIDSDMVSMCGDDFLEDTLTKILVQHGNDWKQQNSHKEDAEWDLSVKDKIKEERTFVSKLLNEFPDKHAFLRNMSMEIYQIYLGV